jgi:hypothetical protein
MTKTLDGAERSHRLDVDSYAGVWRFDPERSSVRFQWGSCEGYDPPDGGGDRSSPSTRSPQHLGRRPRLRGGPAAPRWVWLADHVGDVRPLRRHAGALSDSDSSNSGAGTAGSVNSLPARSCDQPDAQGEANEGDSTLPQTGTLRCAFDRSPSPEERLRLRDLRRARCASGTEEPYGSATIAAPSLESIASICAKVRWRLVYGQAGRLRVKVTCAAPLGVLTVCTSNRSWTPSSPSQSRIPRPMTIGTTITCR